MFETVPFGAEIPIGNVTELTVKLKTLHRWITGCRWHELHVRGWAIILKDDDDAVAVKLEQHTRWSVRTSWHMVIVNVHTLLLLCQSTLGENCCVAEFALLH